MSETITPPELTEAPEKLKSFDVLSSVRLYQFDLAAFGRIRPETRQRVYEEELSYIAEGLDRQNYTEFTLRSKNGELAIFHEGEWQPYISTLERGLHTAQQEAALDRRKDFEVRRRAGDLERGHRMLRIEPGKKMHWYYDFPKDAEYRHGAKFLEGMGYQPARQLGYLCEAEKNPDGSVTIRQQSVDNSDIDAFETAMLESEASGSFDKMRQVYDSAMEQKNGAEFYAGRRKDQKANIENAWELVVNNRDLIEGYFLTEIERLASCNLPTGELETAKKRLTYGVWARLKERIDQQAGGAIYAAANGGYSGSIQVEVEAAYASASAKGEVLFGCGGVITGEKAILQASSKNVFESIFGKKMSCPFCGATQYGDPCSSNQFCTACTAEVKNGKVVSTGRRQIKKGFFEVIAEEFSAWNRKYKLEQAQRKEKLQNKA